MKEYTKAITLIIFGLVIFVPVASTFPDGLETVVEALGIEEHEQLWQGLMPDYRIPAIDNVYASTLLSGIIGTTLVLVAALFVAKMAAKSKEL